MSKPPRATGRDLILRSTMTLVAEGGPVSLESAARQAGLTKPGLMYHFPTKAALMTGLVDHVVDGYERELIALLPDADSASVEQRLLAYVDWTFTADIDTADLVMFTDPRLRATLTERWADRMQVWVDVPDDVGEVRRARLMAARLIADGSWFADATGLGPLTAHDRAAVWVLARGLITEIS